MGDADILTFELRADNTRCDSYSSLTTGALREANNATAGFGGALLAQVYAIILLYCYTKILLLLLYYIIMCYTIL